MDGSFSKNLPGFFFFVFFFFVVGWGSGGVGLFRFFFWVLVGFLLVPCAIFLKVADLGVS